MENFIVSARKYRPSTFDSVIGQVSITTTLKNAIRNNHLAQAYLFTGPRGVGKTTCARIFAKTINCNALTEKSEPCNTCESCKSFNESRSYNIHELDAASNNSVDDIRTLIEQVRIPPQIGHYSVYIIDEVHMLSSSAFNAFLKTLEEPPRHAVFILATTEKHKILPTILSRCQVFDFSRITVEDTVVFLEKISKNENNEYETDGLNIIAQKADGAMRDALSIYDQIVSFSQGKLTYKNVIENLNVLDYDYFFRLTDAFLESNISNTFLIFDEILAKGFDAHNFISGLSKHFRDLLICKDSATLQLLEVGSSIKEKYKEQTARSPHDFLFDCLAISGQCDMSFKSARNQRLHVELSLVKLCQAIKKKTTDAIEAGVQTAPQVSVRPAANVVATALAPKPAVNSTQINKSGQAPQGLHNFSATTPSIKSVMGNAQVQNIVQNNSAEKQSDDIHTADVSKRNISFTQEQLKEAYFKYTESIKNSRPRHFSALSEGLQITPDNRLQLAFSNQNLEDDFTRNVRLEMLHFICNELLNDTIVIETRILEQAEGAKLFTPEDKYKHLAAKNPALSRLKQQFNLDIE